MPAKITKAGLYDKLSPADYHSDPCPSPSLSATIINTILDECPARGFADHPKSPDYERDDSNKFNMPNVCHALILNAGRDYRAIDAADYRKAEVQKERDKIVEAGHIPILEYQLEEAHEIAKVGTKMIQSLGFGQMWADAKSEVCGFWKEGDIWCRMMADKIYLPSGWKDGEPATIIDYKTTDAPVNEWTVGNYAVNQGWHIQSEWYKRGVSSILRGNRETWKPPRFIYLLQSRKKPYPMMVVSISRALGLRGSMEIERAMRQWGEGLAGRWAGWTHAEADLPSWFEQQCLIRDLMEAEGSGFPREVEDADA